MTPLEKIDFVFFYIREKISVGGNWGYNNIWNHVKQTDEADINETLFKEIIRKLKRDGLLTEVNNPESQLIYHVTFNGLTFDGYTEERKSLDAEKLQLTNIQNRILKLSSKMNCLTAIIAVGTGFAAIYYIFEILNHFFCIYPK